jgi:glycosyltransferase involved in cell wall biosynthesis
MNTRIDPSGRAPLRRCMPLAAAPPVGVGMKVSVAIPTHNSERFIRETLQSVLGQSHPPHEILVFDDGSTDGTVPILQTYGERIVLMRERQGGVARARNTLARRARGDLVAFLDHDDLWHPSYLAAQVRAAVAHPRAAAFFTTHTTFAGDAHVPAWQQSDPPPGAMEAIPPESFITRYNRSTGTFYSMSFCVVRKSVLTSLGSDPFLAPAAGVDDFFLCNQFPLHGPVVLTHADLVAYRLTPGAQSVDRLRNFELILRHYHELEARYDAHDRRDLLRLLDREYASKQRFYGRILIGMSRPSEARAHFCASFQRSSSIVSRTKSLALLVQSLLPPPFAPRGTPRFRR